MADWEQAFRALLATRGGALRSYAYLLTGDTASAGDLVQEALTRVFGRRRVGGDIDQLEAYIQRFPLAAGERYSWNDLIGRRKLNREPTDPVGTPYVIDPVTGRVRVSEQSLLFPMPEEPRRVAQ